MFFKQLAVILQSGLPLIKGLKLLQHRVDKNMALICYKLQQSLYNGSSLAAAMQKENQFFSPLVINLVNAGEESGKLLDILHELSAYYIYQEDLRKFTVKTLVYPIFLLVVSIFVLILFVFIILPILGEVYFSMGIKPQGILAIILEIKPFFCKYPYSISITLGVIIFIGYNFVIKLWHKFREGLGKNNFYRILYEVRFCKLLALLLESGLNITKAIDITITTIDSSHYRRCLYLLNYKLKQGVDIATAVNGIAGIFSPLTLDLIIVGAATGYLPKMLKEAAQIGTEDIKEKLDRLKEFLAPLLLLIVACIIAVIVYAIVGPLFEILSVLPE